MGQHPNDVNQYVLIILFVDGIMSHFCLHTHFVCLHTFLCHSNVRYVNHFIFFFRLIPFRSGIYYLHFARFDRRHAREKNTIKGETLYRSIDLPNTNKSKIDLAIWHIIVIASFTSSPSRFFFFCSSSSGYVEGYVSNRNRYVWIVNPFVILWKLKHLHSHTHCITQCKSQRK